MTTFDRREESFENKYAHDEALRFRIDSRRNQHLGAWAAKLLGKSEADAAIYVQEVLKAELEEAGDEDVFRKIRQDFDAAGVDQSDHQLRAAMDEFMKTAKEQVMKEG